MLFHVKPARQLRGHIKLPSSKSYSIRAFFIALCGGRSAIIAPSDCDDALVARRLASALGAKVKKIRNGFQVIAKAGVRGKRTLNINVGESGTSLRFVLPLLPFFCSAARVKGQGTLSDRPNKHLCESLRRSGLDIRGSGPQETVPIDFRGGTFSSGRIEIDSSVSSQFVSGLMIASPLAGKATRLVMTGGKLVSQDYITMTRQVLAKAGVKVRSKGAREFFIAGQQKFKGLKRFRVPADHGLAAFWLVAAALLKSDVVLKGPFNDKLIQSDAAILGFLNKMGLKLKRSSRSIRLRGPFTLKGGTFSLKDCPDLVPIMAVAAMFAQGPTRLKDIGHARVKESDRITDLRRELLKVGADIEERTDELIIRPKALYRGGVELDPHHDHRLAMAFAVLGLRLGLTVRDVECTAKSYPGFIRDFRSLI
jgi:3-phosphoshikimate 1-carboxyvinyltransferase